MMKSKWGLFFLLGMVLLVSVVLLILVYPKNDEIHLASAKENYTIYCGSCHLLPKLSNIPNTIWKENVLPEMAVRMGYRYNNFNPYKYGMEENQYIRLSNTYPDKPILDSISWWQLHHYILEEAPDSVPNLPIRKGRADSLVLFNPQLLTGSNERSGGVVQISYDKVNKAIMIGDAFGNLSAWKGSISLNKSLRSPVVSSVIMEDTLYVTEIGIMGPSQTPKGALYKEMSDTLSLIMDKLHRPVYTQIEDINTNGKKEIVICEFGNLTGQLSLLVQKGSTYEKRTLMALPGSIKVEIVDMDKDGKKDIVALFSQGREGIYVFYQQDDLNFRAEQVIGLPPEYGLSWFTLLDYNGDGNLDMVLANGDNADYSNFLKPYHGIRLFLNDGENAFVQKWFYPINGVTRVLANDYDQDGDIDFATMSFFPDFKNNAEEGFLYLENQGKTDYSFRPYITPLAKKGNWLVMEDGDFDSDGDVDLILGNFNFLRTTKFRNENPYDFLFLDNKVINN